MLGWVGIPDGDSITSCLLTNYLENSTSLVVQLQTDATGTPQASFSAPGYGQPAIPVYQPGPWAHVAVTYNGYFFEFYINGALAAVNLVPTAPLPISQSSSLFLGSATGGPANLQNVSIWSEALSVGRIQEVMSGADPSEEPGCAAYFPLTLPNQIPSQLAGLPCDLVNNLALTPIPTTGQLVVSEISTQIMPAEQVMLTDSTLNMRRAAARATVPGVTLLRHKDYLALARHHGIDLDSAPDAATLADPDFRASVAWYDELVKDLHPNLAARLRERFYRNFYIGLQLSEKAPEAGKFSVGIVEGVPILTYETASGPQPVAPIRQELLTSTAQVENWVQVFFDVVAIIASVCGIIVAGDKVADFASKYRVFLWRLPPLLKDTVEGAGSKIFLAAEAWLKYLQGMGTSGLMLAAIKAFLVANWWTFAFTVVQIVLQLVGFLALSPMGFFILRGAQFALAFGRFIKDLIDAIRNVPNGIMA